jgi:hypothetical protein
MDSTTAPLSPNNISEMDDEMNASRSNNSSSSNSGIHAPSGLASPRNTRVALLFYCVLFCIALYMISTTLYAYPLFPVQPNSLDWNYNWLIATVFDYYGACLCFGGIVLSSEPSWAKGLAWNMGFVLLGSPVCCLWVIMRIRREGSLRLVDSTTRRDA